MRKRELEKTRRNFNTGLNASELRERVSADLATVRDAYTLAEDLLNKINVLLANVEHDDKPYKALRDLAASAKDASAMLVALRSEARTSIAAHAAAAQASSAPALAHAVSAGTPLALPSGEGDPSTEQ